MYKMIALDMDGTLLRDDKTISTETMNAIKLAKSIGIKVVLATGRPLSGIEAYLKDLDLLNTSDYAITLNGAIVQNTHNHSIISKHKLTIEDFSELYELSKKLQVNFHAFTSDGIITPKMTEYSKLEEVVNNLKVKIVDIPKLKKSMEIIKIMMVDEPVILEKAIKALPSELYKKYTIVRSAPYYLEFLNKDCNKGEGIKILAKYLNIDIKDVICIGDAGNDLHMIKYAGLGVAMGNAFAEVKEIADYITKTNEEDGVAHVIHKFILAS